MDKEIIFIKNITSKIESILENNKFVFLIKTDDYLFDNFILEIIKNNIYTKENTNQLVEHVKPCNPSSIGFLNETKIISTFIINDEFITSITKLLQTPTSELDQTQIFVFPKVLLQNFVNYDLMDRFFNCCVFCSEEFNKIGPSILERSLKEIFKKDQLSPKQIKHLSKLIYNQKYSITEVIFFAFSYPKKILSLDISFSNPHADLIIPRNFLDEKGNEFLAFFNKKIPLEVIESFFRSFINIEKENLSISYLNFEQISNYTQAPTEQLIELLTHATSENFQILIKTEETYTIKIPEYLTNWSDFVRWINHESSTLKQYRQLESLAKDYFQFKGPLMSKDQLIYARNWNANILPGYKIESKYELDKDLINSYIALSENYLEESLIKQQKKRSRLLKNSIRISIAVSIAFLLSSFTALLAYIERNSAIKQQELALQSKADAEQARLVAENERVQAIEARENESLALEKAEYERRLAIESKEQAEIQRKNALNALDMAEKSALEASQARLIAEKNEKLANESKEIAQINFKTSEELRNQQEARASSLEALGHFANGEYEKGILLAQTAFEKNLTNGGFPLQSDIFYALLFARLTSTATNLEIDLEHPAKFIELAPGKENLAVYTINGEIRIYSTFPEIKLSRKIKTGYIQSMNFIDDNQLLFTSLDGELHLTLIRESKFNFPWKSSPTTEKNHFFKLGKSNEYNSELIQPSVIKLTNSPQMSDVLSMKDTIGGNIKSLYKDKGQIIWAEGNKLYTSNTNNGKRTLLYESLSDISCITWSQKHGYWIIGLLNGQLQSVDLNGKVIKVETYSVHTSKISQLKVIPYLYDTELLISTGYDGSIFLFVLEKSIPFSVSISSKIGFPKHRSWITGLEIDPDQKLAYSISNDRSLKIWPLSIAELIQKN